MFNQASILGRVGKDPEARTMPNGKAVSSFSIATSERWKDKQSGEQMEKTEWPNCVAFERTAEIANQYVSKGDMLFVQGKLQTEKWTDKNGVDRYTTKIIVRELKLLPNPKRDEEAPAKSGGSKASPPDAEDFDDDIPF